MKKKAFGRTGLKIPVIGQGTWNVPESGAQLENAKRALRRGIELGMTHIDTAEMYGDGRVEEIVGEALTGIPRESVFLASKVLPGNASYSGTLKACERSLRRLRTDYLDLYMLHWPSAEPLEETMRALGQLVTEGKARFVGISNFDYDDMLEAEKMLGAVPLSCNQVLYHLRSRGIEQRIVPYAEQHDIPIVAYTPFGRGKFPREATDEGSILETIARKHHATPRQIILAFLTRSAVVFTIPKASSLEHVEENARAADIALSIEDIGEIDRAFPVGDDDGLDTL